MQVAVDMTNGLTLLNTMRRAGVMATPTHMLVYAAARALKENPGIHQLIAGNTRNRPEHVDIGLSVAGETFVAPVLIIENADEKTIADIAAETARAPKPRSRINRC
jgi:pyruvate/2-oxoglutarate dehydrogenase complex dihydrolipoamide acyltransferase (E2) component